MNIKRKEGTDDFVWKDSEIINTVCTGNQPNLAYGKDCVALNIVSQGMAPDVISTECEDKIYGLCIKKNMEIIQNILG